MNLHPLISSLLFEAEGVELDFKREQYLFEAAEDRMKSELLKDILAFANAWRRSDAYILIGVEEVKEAESSVVGIQKHIDDAQLQQFVNSKTNRPVEFSYTPTLFREKQIGIIRIPVQDRPTFLIKDFGSLRRNTVYLRRGSSTDVARPDEIARMGQVLRESETLRPLLVPQIATGSDWSTFVDKASFEAVNITPLDIKNLPDYSPTVPSGPFGVNLNTSFVYTNSNFFRDRAEYLRFSAKLRPIRFAVHNQGTALASDVKLTTIVTDPSHSLELALGSNRPKKPQREFSPAFHIKAASIDTVGSDIAIEKTNTGWTITAYFGKIQAKDTKLTSQHLFLGLTKSGTTELPVSIFADELSSPVNSLLSVDFVITDQELNYEKLTS